MLIHEDAKRYAAVTDDFKPRRFDNPDDQFAFIEDHLETIWASAQEGFALHGRGVVVLQQQGHSFIRSGYALPGPGDLDHLRPEASEDLEGYDPRSQMLVGIVDPDGWFSGFWKMEFR